MSTIATLTLPVDGFTLGKCIQAMPEVEIQLERVIPTEEGPLPYFWVCGCPDPNTFERIAREQEAVESITCIDQLEWGSLYRAKWNHRITGFVTGLRESEATILDARGNSDGWRFELRFRKREQIQQFHRYCLDNEIPIRVKRLYSLTQRRTGTQYDLTDDQRETLIRAYKMGYFESPRGASQSDLAREFNITQKAVSRRIQRGLSRLIANTLIDGE
ncbi:helix-turn-helix domain-containing protein [Haloferacaceae archaeon DSL9]